MGLRSFDAPRSRRAPTIVEGTSRDGTHVSRDLVGLTLIVAVKTMCDGCRDFIHSELREFADVPVFIISAEADVNGEWEGAMNDVIIAPRTMDALEIRWPPFYVLVDPLRQCVVTEGVVFGPSQVAEEIAVHLSR